MNIAIITGSCGLVGSESAFYFAQKKFKIVGIDNDMRAYFFGPEASTKWMKPLLVEQIAGYRHYNVDIRDYKKLEKIFTISRPGNKFNLFTAS